MVFRYSLHQWHSLLEPLSLKSMIPTTCREVNHFHFDIGLALWSLVRAYVPALQQPPILIPSHHLTVTTQMLHPIGYICSVVVFGGGGSSLHLPACSMDPTQHLLFPSAGLNP